MRVLLTRPQKTLLHYRVPDLGLGYLATGLRNTGHLPVLCVPGAEGWTSEHALEALRSNSIDVMGMKVMTADLSACRHLYDAVIRDLPHIAVVLGGPHVCGAKASVFDQFPGLDYAFVGEGDEVFPGSLCCSNIMVAVGHLSMRLLLFQASCGATTVRFIVIGGSH